jgi:hypothetical protein
MDAQALVFQNTTFSIVDHNGQPWLRAAEIAQALGYGRSDKVTRLYSRNAGEFTDCMTAVVETPTSGFSGNLTTETRIFSLRGAHLVAMFARTDRAAEFRRWVLDILDRETAVPPAPTFPVPSDHWQQIEDSARLARAVADAVMADPDYRLGRWFIAFNNRDGSPYVHAMGPDETLAKFTDLDNLIRPLLDYYRLREIGSNASMARRLAAA